MDAASERARFREAVDRLRDSCGYSMDAVAQEFGVSLNLAQRWRSETGRHKPRAGWEAVLAEMAERGAAANRERAEAAVRLAKELQTGRLVTGHSCHKANCSTTAAYKE